MAKLSGLTVITTGSPRNHALLKSVGADAVFDYHDPDVVQKIRQWVSEKGFGPIGIQKALDTASKDGSTKLVAESLGDKGGKIIILCGYFPRLVKLTLLFNNGPCGRSDVSPVGRDPDAKYPDDVVIKYIGLYAVLYEKNTQDFADIQEWFVVPFMYTALTAEWDPSFV